MSNAAKNFDILVWAFYIIILIVQNYFCDLYPAKILDLSGKPFPFFFFHVQNYLILKTEQF